MSGRTHRICRIDGTEQVAVIFSLGMGGGYSTKINTNIFTPEQMEFLTFGDRKFIRMIENRESANALYVYASSKLPLTNIREDNFKDLYIHWVPRGKMFRITMQDGCEGVEVYKPERWTAA